MRTRGHKVGLSLSLCVKDIVEGKVDALDVHLIVASTFVKTPREWDRVIEHYTAAFWQADPKRAAGIVRALLKWDCIRQPRLEHQPSQIPAYENGQHWVDNLSEVRYKNVV